MAAFVDKLVKYHACVDAVTWVATDYDGEVEEAMIRAWIACVEPTWMYWLVLHSRLGVESFRQELLAYTTDAHPDVAQALALADDATMIDNDVTFTDRGVMYAIIQLTAKAPETKTVLLSMIRRHFLPASVAAGFARLP